MSTGSVCSTLALAACTILFSLNTASAGFPAPPGLPGAPDVNIRINGFLPAPPGVQIHVDSGRPYYVERGRRVYIERERPIKQYKNRKKHHENRGRKYGHDKQDRRNH